MSGVDEVSENNVLLPPPGWEEVRIAKEGKVYYWNTKTGATSWSFPKKEAEAHVKMVRRHTYENMVKPLSPSNEPHPPLLARSNSEHELASPQTPPQTPPSLAIAAKVTPSRKKGYENVVWGQSLKPMPVSDPPSCDSHVTSTDASLSPPLPNRKYLETDLPFSPTPQQDSDNIDDDIISSSVPPGEATPTHGGREGLNGESPQHEVSALGNEYAVVDHIHHKKMIEEVGMNEEAWSPEAPPTCPLRAYQRMNSREDLVTENERGVVSLDPKGQGRPSNYAVLDMTDGGETPSPSNEAHQPTIAYAIVKLDSTQEGWSERDELRPRPLSPRPYEVASPTGNKTNHVITSPSSPSPSSQAPPAPQTDPHYEEIQEDSPEISGDGYMKVDHSRPRGYSSPVSPVTPGKDTPTFLEGRGYDLPSNSRKLQGMNITLPRGVGASYGEGGAGYYSKLSLTSREALLLRSGVTLRRNLRPESVSSFTSFTSQQGEEGQGGRASGEGSSSDGNGDSEEPINKCIRSLESSLVSPEEEEKKEGFKMIQPSYNHTSSQSRRRTPHAYERIMGASQDELDWDETDLGGGAEVGGGDLHGLIKVNNSDPPKLEQRVRIVHHQYEEVELKGAEEQGEGLPRGWEKLKDDQQRQYYWHIPTGKTQYTPPLSSRDKDKGVPPKSPVSPPASEPSPPVPSSSPAYYLGSLPVSEDKLVTGQCVKAVHSCISKVTAALNVKDQTKGEAVFLQVKGLDFFWLHPQTLSQLRVQPINRIRVWGIGLENERDFGYVARDKVTQQHQCHVFRCGVPARIVAQRLLQSHQRERKARQSSPAKLSPSLHSISTPALHSQQGGKNTPTNPGPHHGSPTKSNGKHFLQPPPSSNSNSSGGGAGGGGGGHHESSNSLECVYIGCCEVSEGQGMNVINNAIMELAKDQSKWRDVVLDVAISNVTVCDPKSGSVLCDHRVRYLCFLGIGSDDRFCGYILDSGDKGGGATSYIFYGYHMSPNTDRICIALHSACQARYKRVMEMNSHRTKENTVSKEDRTGKSSSGSLFERLGSGRRSKGKPLLKAAEEGKSFIVQYMGQRPVDKIDGLDTVKPVVQDLAVPAVGRPPYMVKFDVTPSGLSISDPQNKSWAKREFSVKNITYVVKIRKYFAFVSREKGKYFCHVFLEFKIDSGTIVSTIQHMLVPAARK